jgi:predicted DNA-binding protein (MmcQ/YjbR family)
MARDEGGKGSKAHDAPLRRLREVGLSYPGAHKKAPWPGHWDLAVADKTFAYLSLEGEPLSMSCKLPQTSEEALMLPGTSPTAYGLGKWGWVSISFAPGDPIPVEMLLEWLDESYRAQAPKQLVRQLEAGAGGGQEKKVSRKKKPATRR